jgi:hypothetical protein
VSMIGGMGRAALVALALLPLAGCGWWGGRGEPVLCPDARLLEGAERTASYAGAERVDANLRYVAGLTDLRSGCRYDGRTLEVDLAFELVVEPGPALEAAAARITYFIASVGPGEEVLSKRLVTTEVDVAARARAVVVETVTVAIPAASEAEVAALAILVGFQLDEPPRRRPPPRLAPLPLPPPNG